MTARHPDDKIAPRHRPGLPFMGSHKEKNPPPGSLTGAAVTGTDDKGGNPLTCPLYHERNHCTMADLNSLRRFLIDELKPARNQQGDNGYVCPVCGSGSRGDRNSDGALSYYPDTLKWYCHACQAGGDIFDLYRLRDGLTASEAAAAVLKKYGDHRRSTAAEDFAPAAHPRRDPGQAEPPAGQLKDYRPFLASCHAALNGSRGAEYLARRGLTSATLERFNLGYDAAHDAIVIPYPGTPRGYYVTRAIRNKQYFKPRRAEAGAEPVFNAGALYSGAEAVFIVESQLCAISIEQAGGAAVAIGGSGDRKLLDLLRQRPTAAALIVALDNDQNTEAEPTKHEQTEEKARQLTEALTSAGCHALQDNSVCGSCKDPNDALQADPAAFAAAILASVERAASSRGDAAAAQLDAYNAQSAAGMMGDFAQYVEESNTPAIPTGFPGLDRRLEGGLYEGLYILGAISSLGKTTFALQVIDQIARAGHDCLVFSLEMARNELIAKSISRLTYQQGGRDLAKTTRGITVKRRYERYNDKEKAAIYNAMQTYSSDIAPRVWIFEGIGNIGVTEIREAVARHKAITGRFPVVLIDYLQILAPIMERGTDKQNTDKSVLELKRMSRDYKIPVIAISSLNRDNYTAPINLAAFKESGAIEYSADVLLGMQYSGMDYQEGEADKARDKRIRELFKSNEAKGRDGAGVSIDLKILKKRNGGRGMAAPLTFYPMFNTYAEGIEGFTEVAEDAGEVFKNARKV